MWRLAACDDICFDDIRLVMLKISGLPASKTNEERVMFLLASIEQLHIVHLNGFAIEGAIIHAGYLIKY